MSIECPKCTDSVDNKANAILLGALGRVAFPKYVFPADVQRRINTQRVICSVLFFAVFVLMFYFAFLRAW
jgi:hypothetical protein